MDTCLLAKPTIIILGKLLRQVTLNIDQCATDSAALNATHSTNATLRQKVKHLVPGKTRCSKVDLRFLFAFVFKVLATLVSWNNGLREAVVSKRFCF